MKLKSKPVDKLKKTIDNELKNKKGTVPCQ